MLQSKPQRTNETDDGSNQNSIAICYIPFSIRTCPRIYIAIYMYICIYIKHITSTIFFSLMIFLYLFYLSSLVYIIKSHKYTHEKYLFIIAV